MQAEWNASLMESRHCICFRLLVNLITRLSRIIIHGSKSNQVSFDVDILPSSILINSKKKGNQYHGIKEGLN